MRKKHHSPHPFFLLAMLCLALLFNAPQKAYASKEDTHTLSISAIHKILNWEKDALHSDNSILSSTLISNAGTNENDWLALALGRLGNQMDYDAYLTSLISHTANQYKNQNRIISTKPTDWHRLALTMLSLGGDPTAINYDVNDVSFSLIKDGIYDFTAADSFDSQGISGLAYALITLDSYRYKVPTRSKYSREDLIKSLIDHQNTDGGFSFYATAKNSDPELTAVVIQALSPYYNQTRTFHKKTVRTVIDDALAYLSHSQSKDGTIHDTKNATLESTAQAIIACTTLGIDPHTDSRFVKENKSLLDGLLLFQQQSGGFSHSTDALEDNATSTQQALCALVSYIRYLNGNRTFYDMRPEINPKTKKAIASLEQELIFLSEDTPELLQRLYKDYCAIPQQERSYVYHYYKLADAMAARNMPAKQTDFIQAMAKNEHGNGFIYNIVSKEPNRNETHFMENDLKTYEGLSMPYSVDDYGTVISLLLKLKRTTPDTYPSECASVISYDALLKNLEEEKSAIETMNVKIEKINAEIKENLEPFTHITKKDKELIHRLMGESAALNKNAQEKIIDYDQLQNAYNELNADNRTVLMRIILCMLVLLLAVPVIIRFYQKQKVSK